MTARATGEAFGFVTVQQSGRAQPCSVAASSAQIHGVLDAQVMPCPPAGKNWWRGPRPATRDHCGIGRLPGRSVPGASVGSALPKSRPSRTRTRVSLVERQCSLGACAWLPRRPCYPVQSFTEWRDHDRSVRPTCAPAVGQRLRAVDIRQPPGEGADVPTRSIPVRRAQSLGCRHSRPRMGPTQGHACARGDRNFNPSSSCTRDMTSAPRRISHPEGAEVILQELLRRGLRNRQLEGSGMPRTPKSSGLAAPKCPVGKRTPRSRNVVPGLACARCQGVRLHSDRP